MTSASELKSLDTLLLIAMLVEDVGATFCDTCPTNVTVTLTWFVCIELKLKGQ